LKEETNIKKREFPYYRNGWGSGSINRNEPSAHEFRSRKNTMLLSTAMILYVGLEATIQGGAYGIINISNPIVLEFTFYATYLWCIYRYRVVCFDRIEEWNDNVISIINQNISIHWMNSWINVEDRYLENVQNIDDRTKINLKKQFGEMPDLQNLPKGIGIKLEFYSFSGLLEPIDIFGRCSLSVKTTKGSSIPEVGLFNINLKFHEIVFVLFRSYKLLARWDDSFSEWIAPWLLIVISFVCLYVRIFNVITNVLV